MCNLREAGFERRTKVRREMKHTFPDSTYFNCLKPRKRSKERLPTPVIERLALIPLVIPLFIGAVLVAVLS